MSSGCTSRWQRFKFKAFPFLYKVCPEGNYHKKSDVLCYCRLNEYCGKWNGGILNLKTGEEYIPVKEYMRVLKNSVNNQFNTIKIEYKEDRRGGE